MLALIPTHYLLLVDKRAQPDLHQSTPPTTTPHIHTFHDTLHNAAPINAPGAQEDQQGEGEEANVDHKQSPDLVQVDSLGSVVSRRLSRFIRPTLRGRLACAGGVGCARA